MLTSTYKVGGVKKGLKHAYLIFEWSLIDNLAFILKALTIVKPVATIVASVA